MPDVVIDRVNELGKDEPELVTFTDRHGQDLATTMAGIPNDDLHLPAIDDRTTPLY